MFKDAGFWERGEYVFGHKKWKGLFYFILFYFILFYERDV